MICLILAPLITMGMIEYKVQFWFMGACTLGLILLIVLLAIKYAKGAYSKKEYVIRALSLYIPNLLFPAYTFARIWIYYLMSNDNDPLGYLWVMDVLPQTLVYFLVGGLIILVTALCVNNDKKRS